MTCFFSLGILFSACASLSYVSFAEPLESGPRVGSAGEPGEGAYIVGRFVRERAEHKGDIGLSIRHIVSGREYVFRFLDAQKTSADSLYAVAVPPGEYKIVQVVFADGLGLEQGRSVFVLPGKLDALTRVFEVRPGKAYYVGDYFGTTQKTDAQNQWRVDRVRYDFETAERDFRGRYPALKLEVLPAFRFPAQAP